ncbi:type I-C CRISPR-associated protein Cas8c/Csd1 [Streptomyces cheonanensis]|uniref:Type I-C CRISPR-associated protein Cas8c/Csd1 n=1 Tax=Streptomyces cheonanensis TaxID=312720 RepID=A0ABP5GX29_9ACTN
MLLQALNDFAARSAGQLPAAYYREKTVHWVLRIAEDGRSAEVQGEGPLPPKRRAEALIEQVPHVQRSGTKVPPYLLVDTAEFVLQVPKSATGEAEEEKAAAEAERRHAAWRELALAWARRAPDDPAAVALHTYLTHPGTSRAVVPERVEAKDMVAVRVGPQWLHALPSVQEHWAGEVRRRKGDRTERSGLCLVCGTHAPLLSTIPEPIKKGAVPTAGGSNEGQLISINATAQGRQGITQLANTPICHTCGGRAMASLNHLLASDRHSRRFRDHGALVWWTRHGTSDDEIDALMNDEADEGVVARAIDSIQDRPTPYAVEAVDADLFYGLTLGLNNARIVVRDWIDVPVPALRANWGRWFAEHGLFDGWTGRTQWAPIWRMAQACGRFDGARYVKDSVPRGLEHGFLHAALRGLPLPARTLPLVLQRIQADRRIDLPRAALLRLILNRPFDRDGTTSVTNTPEKLDENSTDPSYTAGRIFYVLEEVQRQALHNLNASLRDKHFRTAMIAPLTTLTQLTANSIAHFKRLSRDNPKAGTALMNRLTALQDKLDRPLPQHLTPLEQARFVLGYFHQRQAALEAVAQHKKNKGTGTDAEADGPSESESESAS